jgi:hypothetical protein
MLDKSADVCGGSQLSKSAASVFPNADYWCKWGQLFDGVWTENINNVVKFRPDGFYWIDPVSEKQLRAAVSERIRSASADLQSALLDDNRGLISWADSNIHVFVRTAVRGFLRCDLYCAMTEFLSRAEGSFGLQAHCSVEPGVVVIASKGQPMSMSFDPASSVPICLYGSEATAVAVPVDSAGTWLKKRIDLDSKGEIIRLGRPKLLLEGSYRYAIHSLSSTPAAVGFKPSADHSVFDLSKMPIPGLFLRSGLQILSYSVVSCRESDAFQLIGRSTDIKGAPIPYDATADLVAEDLAMTPGIVRAIEKG